MNMATTLTRRWTSTPATGAMPPGSLGARIGTSLARHLAPHLLPDAAGVTGVRGRAVVTGPRVVSLGYDLGPLSPLLMRRAQHEDLLAVIAHEVGVAWLTTHRADGLFWYAAPNPRPYLLSATAFEGSGLEAAIGVDRQGRAVDVDLQRHPHLLLAMPSGGGKTTAAQAYLYRLCDQNGPHATRLIVLAGDLPRWRPLEALPHLWGIVHHAEAAAVLTWLAAEVERREAAGITDPRIVCVIDDAHSMVERGGIAAKTMVTLSQQSRRAGVHLVITAHGTNATNLGSNEVAANIARRIVAATSTDAATRWAGQARTGAHRLAGQGEAMDIDGIMSRPVTLAVIAPDDFAALGARWGQDDCEPAPWSLQPVATVATGGWRVSDSAVATATTGATVATVARLPRREPTTDDLDRIRANFAACGGSKSQTCRATWGTKDGNTWRWLAMALAADEDEEEAS